MAAEIAYERPSIQSAWQAFLNHLPTMLLIWVAMILLSAIGAGIVLFFQFIGAASGGAVVGPDGATATVAIVPMLFGQLGQAVFSVLSSLVGVLLVAVPALHYESGETISTETAFRVLLERPLRYLLAGILFSVTLTIGLLLCVLPGLAVAMVGPVYVNRIFTGDQPILEAFQSSFQSVYRSEQGLSFVGIQILTWLLVLVVSVCTCGLGALVAVPVGTFYIQNTAYHKGVLS